jgi:tRNA(fMet)-specific endonuclease VapC
MVVLDTDHVSVLEHETSEPAKKLQERLQALPLAEVTTSVISFEEQVRGWFSLIARAKDGAERVHAYGRLKNTLDNYANLTVLAFDSACEALYQELRGQKLRIGAQDLKIAAISLRHDATLLTRNLSDFKKVPKLKAEDWTK